MYVKECFFYTFSCIKCKKFLYSCIDLYIFLWYSLVRRLKYMITSSKIQETILELLADNEIHTVQEMKNFLCTKKLNDFTEGQFAGSINTLLRNNSLEKVDRGMYLLRKEHTNMKKCFVICPIGNENSSTRINADKLFKYIITPVCKECDFEPIRVNQLSDANSITQTIVEHLEQADLVIADISEHNPNVFYEIGYRSRTQKPIIHLRNKDESLPFDIASIRTYNYDLTDLDSVEDLKERLVKTINSFNFTSTDSFSDKPEIENTLLDIMPILYQILDSVYEVKKELKNANNETIGTVIKSMQSSQPQVSPDTAMQMQLISSVLQNPDLLYKLIELSDKLPQ